jgi:hypothetical protein
MSNYCSNGHWEAGMSLPCKQCEITRLTKQRDELVAALDAIFASVLPYRDDGSMTIPEHVTDRAVEALAKVKEPTK